MEGSSLREPAGRSHRASRGTQGISTPILAAGALEKAVLQPPGRPGPLLRLSVFLLKRRPDFCPGGVTHFTKQYCPQAWLLTADPDAPRDSHQS